MRRSIKKFENLLLELLDLNQIFENHSETSIPWKSGTTLIVGDSMLGGIDEKRIHNSKVRVFPGATIEDLYFNLYPLLRKRPSNIILHIGTNNAKNDSSIYIKDKLIKLKTFIASIVPNCKIVISTLINRNDDGKAQLTVIKVNQLLMKMNIPLINNENIKYEHLGRKGLHLNQHGTGKLAVNFIKALRAL